MHTMQHPNSSPKRQADILANGIREQVIEWLEWNDPNGVYSDIDSTNNVLPPLTLEQAREYMRGQIEATI